MLPHKCVLHLLAAYLMLEEVSSSVLTPRIKKDIFLLNQELPQDLVDISDLSVGDVGDTGREIHGLAVHHAAGGPSHSQQNPHQFFLKTNEHKRRKVAPLDSLSSFRMSSVRNRKGEHVTK